MGTVTAIRLFELQPHTCLENLLFCQMLGDLKAPQEILGSFVSTQCRLTRGPALTDVHIECFITVAPMTSQRAVDAVLSSVKLLEAELGWASVCSNGHEFYHACTAHKMSLRTSLAALERR